jgi:hypothetical protein
VQRAVEQASTASACVAVFQVLCTACMVLGFLSAIISIPSVAPVATTIALGAIRLLEQLVPVAIIIACMAFLSLDSEILYACLKRSRYPITSMLRLLLTGKALPLATGPLACNRVA